MSNAISDKSAHKALLKQDASVIGIVSIGHGIAHFYNLILPPLFPWIREEFHLSWAQLGFLMTLYFLVSGVAQTVAGFLVDRFGACRVLRAGLLCLSISSAALALADSYLALMAGAMLAGLGNSVFHPADFSLLNRHVSQRNLGHAYSTHGISGNLGWACAPVFLLGITHLSSWRNALFAAALLPLFVLFVLVWRKSLFCKDMPQISTEGKNQASMLSFLRLPAVWVCFSFFLITALALGGIQSFSAVGLQQLYKMSVPLATTAFTLYMLGSAAGMVAGGFLTARTRAHESIVGVAFFCAALCTWLIASGNLSPPLALLCMTATGIGAGIAGPARDFLIRAAAPKEAMGRVYGIVYGGLELGFACAPILFGHMMDAKRADWVFIGIGVCQMLAIFTAIGVKSKVKQA